MTNLNSEGTPKIYFHDQEMVGEESDWTSISINPAKRKTTRKDKGRSDKMREEPSERGSRKIEEEEQERARTCIFLRFTLCSSGN